MVSYKHLHPLTIAGLFVLTLLFALAIMPEQAFYASLQGIHIWWTILFPALFPFFVISELLLGIGIVHFFGKLLDPLMRPLFRLPGIGGFVVAMGYISGYPVGARLTARLIEQQHINRIEAERLIAFTTTSDPIFLIGAVSIGFFHNSELAVILCTAHYGGAFLIGLLMRFHGRKEEQPPSPSYQASLQPKYKGSRLKAAIRAMHDARLWDGRNGGQIMSDAIQSALKLIMVVGGLVVFFSVALELLQGLGIISLLAIIISLLLEAIGAPISMANLFIFGLFEVTLGAREAATSQLQLIHQAAAAAWVLSWAGLSVHAQVASIISRTTIRYTPLLFARFLHSILAVILVYLLWNLLGPA